MARNKRKFREPRRSPICYVIGEGATEAFYFSALGKALRDGFSSGSPRPAIKAVDAGGKGSEGVAETAAKYVEKHGKPHDKLQYFAVFDTEAAEPKYQTPLKKALALCKKHGIHAIVSNPCFEVWFHCHCPEFRPRSFVNQKACDDALDIVWRKSNFCRDGYKKADRKLYEQCAERHGEAIDVARSLRETHRKKIVRTAGANAATDVYRLIEFLKDPKKSKFTLYDASKD